ncbi:MAG: hypothetical protein K9H64_21725 [Bacteroidales bacterium]|nr:hypothetical protein [Bacteroidales bacterium]MCF8458639.1 hypothetical protein [Bacteroidales bacterium]
MDIKEWYLSLNLLFLFLFCILLLVVKQKYGRILLLILTLLVVINIGFVEIKRIKRNRRLERVIIGSYMIDISNSNLNNKLSIESDSMVIVLKDDFTFTVNEQSILFNNQNNGKWKRQYRFGSDGFFKLYWSKYQLKFEGHKNNLLFREFDKKSKFKNAIVSFKRLEEGSVPNADMD